MSTTQDRLRSLLERHRARRVFLVTGRSSYALSGAEAALAQPLAGRVVHRFFDFSPNPTAADVDRGVQALRAFRPDLVIAIGGGSALDVAKLVNLVGVHEGGAADYILGRRPFTDPGLPLIAIPTTAGTGAEVTHFATVYLDDTKYSATHEAMRPNHFILDSTLTHSLPPTITASTGIDALAQGIESYWSTRSTEASQADALAAVVGARAALRDAVTVGSDEARAQMLEASHLAGRAIDISRTSAPHALSYAFTIRYGVPHGHAVGLTLGAIFAHNAAVDSNDVIDPRGADFVHSQLAALGTALGCTDDTDAQQTLQDLMGAIGLETRLGAIGVPRADLADLVRSVNAERLATNPRNLPSEAVGRILESIY